LQLRRATAQAHAQFSQLLASSLERNKSVYYGGPIVEAFPNAFLAVLIPEVELLSAPKLKRGRRFDWLYEQIADKRLVLATTVVAVATLGETGT
jgi:hypothetical protein